MQNLKTWFNVTQTNKAAYISHGCLSKTEKNLDFCPVIKLPIVIFFYNYILKNATIMQEQNFKKHAQYIPGFHFLTLGIIFVCLVIAIILLASQGFNLATVFDLLVTVSLGLLFYYTRQFATGNQDRIIRSEENFRSFRLTGKVLNERLTRAQVIALRFANDEEYSFLTEKTIKENLSTADIKKAIQQWRADHHRI